MIPNSTYRNLNSVSKWLFSRKQWALKNCFEALLTKFLQSNDGNNNSSSSIRFQFQPLKVWILSQNGFFLESDENLKTTLKRFRPNFFKRMLVKLIHNFPKFSLKVSLFWKVSRTQRLLWSFFEPISSSRPHKVNFSHVGEF